jgi:hypothetical protein
MALTLKALWSRLMGGGQMAEAGGEIVEYGGYRIRPTPFSRRGQYQTSGTIEKEVRGELMEHRFIRAEAHATRQAAIEFSIEKAKQLIDEQGERLFG